VVREALDGMLHFSVTRLVFLDCMLIWALDCVGRCHRNLKPGESLTKLELGLLKLINSIYFLPPWVSISHYVDLANAAGLQVGVTGEYMSSELNSYTFL
jgi:hypothetical protein